MSVSRAPPRVRALSYRTEGEPLTVGVSDLLGGGTDAEFREFVADLFAAASGMQALRRALGKTTDLSGSGVAVLLAIRRLSDRDCVSVREIADHLHVAAPHVTTELGKLAAARLVTKRATHRDPRAVDVKLTAKGQKRLQLLTALVRRVNDALFAEMSQGEMQQVHRFLRRIIARASEAAERLSG